MTLKHVLWPAYSCGMTLHKPNMLWPCCCMTAWPFITAVYLCSAEELVEEDSAFSMKQHGVASGMTLPCKPMTLAFRDICYFVKCPTVCHLHCTIILATAELDEDMQPAVGAMT